MSSQVVLILIFVLVWAGVTGSFEVLNLLFGLLLALAAIWLVRERKPDRTRVRLLRVAGLIMLFVVELVKSSWRVAKMVVRPRLDIHPAVIAYPLRVTRDFEIMLLANLITLTPGTLSVDVSADRRLLFVHCIDVDDVDAVIADIRNGFEARIMEAFR
jgi:multicomponent Na+:H+ antiporter subunit E